jgi:hypothetical protein
MLLTVVSARACRWCLCALQKWTFYLKDVYDGEMLNMCIKVTPAPASDRLVIKVVGPRAHKLFDPNVDWSMTVKHADFTTPRGTVALTAPASWGRVYSRGIFVAVDEVLKALRVAVNVRTQLSRDRHVLPDKPTPLQSLAEILAELVRGQHSSCTALFTHLLDRFLNDKLNDHIVTAAGDTALKPVMRSYHAKQLGTTVDRIVYTAEECDARVAFVLDQLNVSVQNNSGALEDTIDLKKRILQLLRVCPDYVVPTTEASYLKALKKYVAALSLNYKHYQDLQADKFIVSVKETPLKQYCAAQYSTQTVYMTGDLLQGDNWRVAAVIILQGLSIFFGRDMLVPLAIDQQRFLADPLNFEPRRVQRTVENLSAQGSSSASQQRLPRVSYATMRLPSSSPKCVVRPCSFNGVPQSFSAAATEEAVENHTDLNSCAGGLMPEARIPDTTYSTTPTYVDAALIGDPAFAARMRAVDNMDRRILHASQLLRVMRRNIVQELKPYGSSSSAAVSDDARVPIVMVICNDCWASPTRGQCT